MVAVSVLVLASLSAVTAFRPMMPQRLGLKQQAPALRETLSMVYEAIPHGGTLKNTMLSTDAEKQAAIKKCDFEVELDERQLCDVELLMQGGFSPLTGYMGEADYKSVVTDLKLTNGLIFGLPVVFDTNDARVVPGKKVLLSYKGTNIATLDVASSK
jgi:sulfate adenylyltransferase